VCVSSGLCKGLVFASRVVFTNKLYRTVSACSVHKNSVCAATTMNEMRCAARQCAATPTRLLLLHHCLLYVYLCVCVCACVCVCVVAGQARQALAPLLAETNASSIVLWTAKAALGLGICDQAMRLTLQVGVPVPFEHEARSRAPPTRVPCPPRALFRTAPLPQHATNLTRVRTTPSLATW
jgi:hypothetical protein